MMSLFVRARHDVTGAEAEFPAHVAPVWARLGWAPVTSPRDEATAEVERIAAENATAAHLAEVAEPVTADKAPVIDEVLAHVGDDPAAAQVALDAELARPKPRTTLVDRLNQIVTPTAGDAGIEKEN